MNGTNETQSFVENIAACARNGRLDVELAQRQLLQVINETLWEANRNPDWRLATVNAIYVKNNRVHVDGEAEFTQRRKVEAGR